MGCIFSCFKNPSGQVPLEETTDEPKVYSWDKRDKLNVEDFIIDGKKGETVVKHAGSVNGEQIVVQNCEDCNIYVFDHIATVSVDDCVNCNIFLGPIKSSVFVRDCKQCRLVVACQQFRTRDCFQIDTFLLCGTQPIIESSSRMKFACYRYAYEQLDSQFKKAGLSVYNNNWSNIHDFTPVPGEDANFSFLPLDAKVEDFVPVPQGEELETMKISVSEELSFVPQTWGKRRKPSHESCLVVFFNDGGSSDRAAKFLHMMRSQHPQCVLIQSKEVSMEPDNSRRVFASDSYANAVLQGPVIGLEMNGEGSVAICQAVVLDLMKGTTGLVFSSQSPQSAEEQIEAFYNFADMQMGI
ncbi:protein XRP2 isoform X2 [Aplysia californica]|uniref:Protein XRP2 n=1 Tax=Aplysia californica TaxID=6500 RepID=A0ABM0JZL5_APLCA|nr:protein XRP2 isoform X2 [Aplysia californica]